MCETHRGDVLRARVSCNNIEKENKFHFASLPFHYWFTKQKQIVSNPPKDLINLVSDFASLMIIQENLELTKRISSWTR